METMDYIPYSHAIVRMCYANTLDEIISTLAYLENITRRDIILGFLVACKRGAMDIVFYLKREYNINSTDFYNIDDIIHPIVLYAKTGDLAKLSWMVNLFKFTPSEAHLNTAMKLAKKNKHTNIIIWLSNYYGLSKSCCF